MVRAGLRLLFSRSRCARRPLVDAGDWRAALDVLGLVLLCFVTSPMLTRVVVVARLGLGRAMALLVLVPTATDGESAVYAVFLRFHGVPRSNTSYILYTKLIFCQLLEFDKNNLIIYNIFVGLT